MTKKKEIFYRNLKQNTQQSKQSKINMFLFPFQLLENFIYLKKFLPTKTNEPILFQSSSVLKRGGSKVSWRPYLLQCCQKIDCNHWFLLIKGLQSSCKKMSYRWFWLRVPVNLVLLK